MLVGVLNKVLFITRVLSSCDNRARIKLIMLCAEAYLEAQVIKLSLNAVHIVLTLRSGLCSVMSGFAPMSSADEVM